MGCFGVGRGLDYEWGWDVDLGVEVANLGEGGLDIVVYGIGEGVGHGGSIWLGGDEGGGMGVELGSKCVDGSGIVVVESVAGVDVK